MTDIPIKRALQNCCPPILKSILESIDTSEIGRRLAKGAFWSISGAVISRGLMLVAFIFVARMLGITRYGELGMIQSTVGMFGIFAGFGLGLTATKYIAELRNTDPDRAGRIICLSGLVAVITGGLMSLGLFIFAPWLSIHTMNAPHLAGVLRIGALILFFSSLNGAQTGALTGFEAFKVIAYVNLVVGIFSFIIMLIGTYYHGLDGAVWALSISLGLNWLMNHIALRREARRYNIHFSFRKSSREFPVLWKFSLPIVLSSAMVGPVTWLSNSIFVNQINGYSSLGIYSAAFQITIIIDSLNSMIGQAFLPVCVSKFKNNSERFDYLNIIFPWVIGIAFGLPFLCVPELWAIFFGGEYYIQSIMNTIVFIVISTIIIAHRQGIARNFVAGGYMWWSLIGNLFWCIMALSFSYLLRKNGAEGRAASFMIAYILNTIIFIPFYVKMELCSKYLLLSRYSLMVWIVIIALSMIVLFMDLGILLRCTLLIAAYLVIFMLFKRLWTEKPILLRA